MIPVVLKNIFNRSDTNINDLGHWWERYDPSIINKYEFKNNNTYYERKSFLFAT